MSELSSGIESADQPIPPVAAGRYEARLAENPEEILLAQRLRYQVMYAEKGGRPDLAKIREKADIDEWDRIAHHIVVIDHKNESRSGNGNVVGTLRLVSNLMLDEGQPFYTEHAYNLDGLRRHYPSMLELGRFCIDPAGRNGAILLLIWKFAMQFIATRKVDVMFGCASFPGTNIEEHRDVLGYLHRNNLAEPHLMPKPVTRHIRISEFGSGNAGLEEAVRNIPTLLRGYLKLGARASDTAIIDPVFNTTFICIYVDARNMMSENTALVTARR